MFVIIDLITVIHTEFVGMFMNYPRTKFQISSGSLVTANKPKAMSAPCCWFSLKIKITFAKIGYFLKTYKK
jgi:hypothetical protein